MIIQVKRFRHHHLYTGSIIFIDGDFECFGLEDIDRPKKVAGETCIPAGVYQVGIKARGGFHNRYKARFPFHVGMLQVLGVPEFTDVLVHCGNTIDDTAGCLLVGTGIGLNRNNALTVMQSTEAYAELYKKVINAAKAGNLKIEYSYLGLVKGDDAIHVQP